MTKTETSDAPTIQARTRAFYHLLVNSTVTAVLAYTVWFAITFYVYLQTHSVAAMAVLSGIFLVATAGTGIWFGSLVDHHRKKQIMLWSSWLSLIAFAISLAVYLVVPQSAFTNAAGPILWGFVLLIMAGVIVGNIRGIAVPTAVTLLIPADRRDKANGLVGTAMGMALLVTSVISGVLVAFGGMLYVLILAIAGLALAIIHLTMIDIPEKRIVHTTEDAKSKKVDIKGTLAVIGKIPGLFALILFTTFNNFLGGVFMALMDAYGLSLVSVEVWGFLWGFLSLGFIVGGALIAKKGLGKNPLRTLLLANLIIWIISSLFTIQSSIYLLVAGTFIYMVIMPFIEASEQTVLQKVVPPERQGRVFGFAQSVEQAASPLTAFFIGPITQFIFIPLMTDGAGAQLVGGWFGTGPDRGIALAFIVAGVLGLLVTLLAMGSKYYRQLSDHYLKS